jgi:hypothetical protein
MKECISSFCALGCLWSFRIWYSQIARISEVSAVSPSRKAATRLLSSNGLLPEPSGEGEQMEGLQKEAQDRQRGEQWSQRHQEFQRFGSCSFGGDSRGGRCQEAALAGENPNPRSFRRSPPGRGRKIVLAFQRFGRSTVGSAIPRKAGRQREQRDRAHPTLFAILI